MVAGNVTDWLKTGMFEDLKPDSVRDATVKKVVDELAVTQ